MSFTRSTKEWGDPNKVARSQAGNYNHLLHFEKEFKEVYPELKEFSLKFVSSVPKAKSQGYRFISPGDFRTGKDSPMTYDEFMRDIGSNWGLDVDEHSRVRYKEMYIMIRPQAITDQIKADALRRRKEMLGEDIQSQTFVHPEDPRANEFIDKGLATSKLEDEKPTRKRGPGRPRKSAD